MELNDLVVSLKGVGPQVAAKLNKLNIYTIKDLMEHYPREYEDRRKIVPIAEATMGEVSNLLAVVASPPQVMKKGNKVIVKFRIKDATGSIFVVFYGQPYMKNNFTVGDRYIFYGKIKKQYNTIEMDSPEYEKVQEDKTNYVAKITPIYPLTAKLSQKVMRQLIEQSLAEGLPLVEETLPLTILEKHQLMGKQNANANIHFPKDNDSFFKARERLVFEELFMLQLSLSKLKTDFAKKNPGIQKEIPTTFKAFIEQLPFELTGAQKRVLKEIIQDMKHPTAMNRLIQGDVGSGKTVIAAVALFIVAGNSMQGALMAPTEVLAVQHHEFLQSILGPFGIQVGLLTGSTTKKQKDILRDALVMNQVQVVVGTHALIEDNIEFSKLGLVITDEQHRFGVRQRLRLSEKGITPDIMVMTATPIPRTLALILYGDMDISIIDELPPGRTPIKTNAVDSSYHVRIYRFIKKQVEEGRQCYIICPMVEENETQTELKNVMDYASYLKEEVFQDLSIGYLHGKMKPREKNEIMAKFSQGEIAILVSTTVVEVGVNVPNATVMLIENAERFGLAQLHQLRGRVGRGKHQSYCVLVSDSKNKVTKKRLQIMEESTDGFVIADTDLKLRGPGEFFGTRQHGLPEMKIANLYTDAKVLKVVQKEVETLLTRDPELVAEDHKQLSYHLQEKIQQEEMHKAL